jgi:hypothetical protein
MTLVHAMEANDIVVKYVSVWATLMVLAPKANQIPWFEYIWRLCVSYRRLNQVTCPYAYPMPRCDDALDGILPGMMFFVSFDLATEYWQIVAAKATQNKLAYYTPEGLFSLKRMPMGALNAALVFVSASNNMKLEWNQGAAKKGINVDKAGAKVIADDILAYATTIPTLISYLRCFLTTLQHYLATVKLKNASGSTVASVLWEWTCPGRATAQLKTSMPPSWPSNHPTCLLTSACSLGCLDSTPGGFQITRSALNTGDGSSNNWIGNTSTGKRAHCQTVETT